MPLPIKLMLFLESPHYIEIVRKYNDEMQRKGKVNNTKFFLENVEPVIPNFRYQNFYDYVQRNRKKNGILNTRNFDESGNKLILSEQKLEEHLQGTSENTRLGIAGSLAIGAEAVKEVLENPLNMTLNERMKLFFDAMKAQDSRIRAIAEIRKDAREERVFDKVFQDAAYVDVE